MKGAAPLNRGVSFDADWLLQDLNQRAAPAVIPPNANSKIQRDYDVGG